LATPHPGAGVSHAPLPESRERLVGRLARR